MESTLTPEAALACLAWQIELGATEAIGDAPVNRYEAGDAAAPRPARRPAPSAAPPTAPRPRAPSLSLLLVTLCSLP